jgi:hypothetical protein
MALSIRHSCHQAVDASLYGAGAVKTAQLSPSLTLTNVCQKGQRHGYN